MISDNNEKQHKMKTLQDLEKQIKKQIKIHNKAKEVAKTSYDNGQEDMLSTTMEEHIAENILRALEGTLERVREREEIRLRGY